MSCRDFCFSGHQPFLCFLDILEVILACNRTWTAILICFYHSQIQVVLFWRFASTLFNFKIYFLFGIQGGMKFLDHIYLGRAILGIEDGAFILSYISCHFLLWDRVLLNYYCPRWAQICNLLALAAECWDHRHVAPCPAHIVILYLKNCWTLPKCLYLHNSNAREFQFLHILANNDFVVVVVVFNYESYSNKWDMVSHGGFDLHVSSD